MPLVESVASAASACVSTAPVFEEWTYSSGAGPLKKKKKSAGKAFCYVDDVVAWWVWLFVCVASLSLGTMAFPLRFVVFSCALSSNSLLRTVPSVAPYWILVLTVPLLTQKSLDEGGGIYTLAVVALLFGVTPFVDIMSGYDAANHSKEEQKIRDQDFKFRLPTFVAAVTVLLNCVYFCHRASHVSSTLEFIGLAISTGTYTGSVGITCAHELCHRASLCERNAGRLILVVCCYGHFYIEHTLGHHKMVGLDADPATAKCNESFWTFSPRSVFGEMISALALANKSNRLYKDIVFPYVASLLFLIALSISFGFRTALPFFLLQASIAIILFEAVNYLEHYGLERQQSTDIVEARHSWDSPHRFTNHLLFQLQRHADHHAHAGKRYQSLQLSDQAPTLPAGYATMILIAFFPPLWRAIMHPRLLTHRQHLSDDNKKGQGHFRHHLAPLEVTKKKG